MLHDINIPELKHQIFDKHKKKKKMKHTTLHKKGTKKKKTPRETLNKLANSNNRKPSATFNPNRQCQLHRVYHSVQPLAHQV